MKIHTETVDTESGAVPVHWVGPEDSRDVPGLVVVPSIFGPATDLLNQMKTLADRALVVIPDPFWHAVAGVVPYTEPETAFARLKDFDMPRCFAETRDVIAWTRARCNGKVAGLGICFGGPVVLTAAAAADGALNGVITWHGTRMENYLERAPEIRCPLHFHFGEADPVTPPDVIASVRAAFAGHDTSFVVHPNLAHGFSHEGPTFDEKAAQFGVDATRDLLASL
jgi:carboxymethylenebutenolidase